MKNKTKLRQEYERLLGRSVCDRTWQRIRRQYLKIENEFDLVHLPAIQGAALLRRVRPSDPVTREDAERFGRVVAHFDRVQSMQGSELRAAIAKCFRKCPSVKWFNSRQVYMRRLVGREKIFEVLAAIVNKRQFCEVREDVPSVKTLAQTLVDEFKVS